MRRALVAQWIERSPAKAEVVGSNPAKRAISFVGDDHSGRSPLAHVRWSRLMRIERIVVLWASGYSLYAVWKMMPSWRIDQ